jgi:hypothetical protein
MDNNGEPPAGRDGPWEVERRRGRRRRGRRLLRARRWRPRAEDGGERERCVMRSGPDPARIPWMLPTPGFRGDSGGRRSADPQTPEPCLETKTSCGRSSRSRVLVTTAHFVRLVGEHAFAED